VHNSGAQIQQCQKDLRKKVCTTSKGYRLKPDTHKFIKSVQKKLNLSQEKAIGMAVRQFYKASKETKLQLIKH